MKFEDTIFEPSKIINIDRIVHAPARLLILAILLETSWVDWVFLSENTKLTKGNLSSHLHKLEEARYIKIKKKFINKIPRTLISISFDGKRALNEYRTQMNAFLNNL